MQEILVIGIIFISVGFTIYKIIKSFIKPKTHCSGCSVSGCFNKKV